VGGLFALQFGERRGGEPVRRGIFILEEAEAESFERGGCIDILGRARLFDGSWSAEIAGA